MDLDQGDPRRGKRQDDHESSLLVDEIKIRHLLHIYEHNTRTETLIKYATLWLLGFADFVALYFFGVSHSSARAAPHRVAPNSAHCSSRLDQRALGSVDHYLPVDLFLL